MTESNNSGPDDGVVFKRRDVLKGVGAVGVLGTFGAEAAGARPPGRMIVGTTPGRADVARGRANRVHRTLKFGDIGEAVVGYWPEQALRGLSHNPHVRYVEPDTEGTRHAQSLPWGVDRVDADIAHDKGDTGNTVHVGIIDSGIDSDHDDLAANLGDGFALEAACDTCDEEWDDEDGHGTLVAGVVGAIDNGIDVIGVSHEVTLHALKDGDAVPVASATAAALEKAVEEGYHVVNISSSLGESETLNDAIAHALDNDVVVVASSGNDGREPRCDDDDCVSFPARHADVIAVSATDSNDGIAAFASTGPEVDLTAPGVAVPSTELGGGTTPADGTSFSAPHVTAAAALLRADGVPAGDVASVLKDNAEDIGLTPVQQGDGLLDVAAALGHLLEVETGVADGLDFTEATLHGEVTALTAVDSVEVGFEWGEEGDGLPNVASAGALSATGPFDVELTGLEENTEYEFRAVAPVTATPGDVSTEYGDVRTFSTDDNEPPRASFTHSPEVPDPDEDVTFTSTATDPEDDTLTYEWDFTNDGSIDDYGQMVTHSYSNPGTVTVRHRVTDEFGQSHETTADIRVNEPPVAEFSVVTDPPVRDEPVSFDASASDDPDGTIVSYEWDFEGDGTFVAAGSSPSHTYTTGGEKTVTLRVTDNDGATGEITKTFHVSIRVGIDVKPNADGVNAVNLHARNVPVAVLHTPAFDTARIDPSTLRFGDPVTVDGGAGAALAHGDGHVEDVDHDGDVDHLGHYPTVDTGFTSSSTAGKLVGETTDGVSLFGEDAVKIVGGDRP